jgi:restriction system protein
MALWLTRAGRAGQNENWALENNRVVNGWDEVDDLSKFSTKEDLLKHLMEVNPESGQKKIINNCGQLWAFGKKIAKGDLVALPLKSRSAIAFGEVVGKYEYYSNNPPGAMHTIPVKWITVDIPRSRFDQDLLYSFGAFMTICQITRNNAEQRIRDLLAGKITPIVPLEPESVEISDVTAQFPSDLAEYAADQISQWLARKFTGHRLADLINAVLEAQGYITEVSPPGADGGVDIIAGKGPLGFDPPRILVQVKGGNSQQDVKVLRELKGIMSDFKAEQGLFVAWGGFKKTVYDEARKNFFDIRLWDEIDIVTNVLQNYDKFPEEIKAELPIKRIWVLVQSEE